MKKRVRRVVLVLCSAVLVGLLFNSLFYNPSFADDLDIVKDQFRLELSPAFQRMTISPGEEKKENLQLKNVGEHTLSVEMYAAPYSADNGALLQNEIMSEDYTKIAKWIKLKGSDEQYHSTIQFELKPNESKDIRYAVKVPTEANGGGQYGIVFAEFSPADEQDDNQAIRARSRTGMALFAMIDDTGLIREAFIKNVQSPKLAIGRNIIVEYDVQNNGNIDFQSSLEMVINSVFGKELYRNTFVETILPENSKHVTNGWADTPSFGLFRLDYTIRALNETEEGGHIVLVMSASALVLSIVILAVLAITIRYFVSKRIWRKRRSDIVNNN